MNSSPKRSSGPGIIYSLFVERKKKEKKKEKKEEKVIEFYKKAHTKVKSSKKPDKKIIEALEYLGWDIPPEAIMSGAKMAAIYGFAAGIVISMLILYNFFPEVLFFWETEIDLYIDILMGAFTQPLFLASVSIPFVLYAAAYYLTMTYPVSLGASEVNKNMMPTLRAIGFITISMKLVPNLEKAIEFAADHSEGWIARELKKMLWNTKLGVYSTMEEAVDKLAYRTGVFAEEFKHALMRIRTSVLEPNDAKRYVLLDNAVKEAMEGVKERLLSIASSLYMPSMQLFYIGVFLPLLLFIVLPVGAAFSESPVGKAEYLIVLYNIGLPVITFSIANSIISKRPPVYSKPDVPDKIIEKIDDVKKKAKIVAILMSILAVGTFYLLHTMLDWTEERVAIDYCGSRTCLKNIDRATVESILKDYDMTPYMLIYGVFAAIVYPIAYYMYTVNKEREKKQNEIMEMEREFKDAVYLLASRLGEGKPLESALESVNEMLPEAKIRKVFQQITYNIKILGMSLHDAVFDRTFGALKDNPSRMLKNSMKVLTSSVMLGTELASKALLSLSEQVRHEEKVVNAMREKMSEVSTMMGAMALMVAPIVLGITVSLEDVIVKALSGMEAPEQEGEIPTEVTSKLGVSMPEIKSISENIAPSWAFLTIVGVYMIEIVVLLTYFSVYILDGKNKIGFMKKTGMALIIGLTLFIITSYVSKSLVSGVFR